MGCVEMGMDKKIDRCCNDLIECVLSCRYQRELIYTGFSDVYSCSLEVMTCNPSVSRDHQLCSSFVYRTGRAEGLGEAMKLCEQPGEA